MTRWRPNARGRLQRAAMELYAEQGFEQTTVAEIATRAGLTERTFFRHFADKREVLFDGAELLQALLVEEVAAAAESATPLESVIGALEAAGEFFPDHDRARHRQRVIAANPDLQERELIKLATLSSALAGALRERGVGGAGASLAAETGVTVFKVAFERWVSGEGSPGFVEVLGETVMELKAVASGVRARRSRMERAPMGTGAGG